jgi:glucose-1-phosphate thymidylyltransferase
MGGQSSRISLREAGIRLKGIILAVGTVTPLYPLTQKISKHLQSVGRLPMIVFSVLKLKQASIHDIVVVTGIQSAGLYSELLGNGKEWGVNITTRIQEEESGMVHALTLAEDFIEPYEKFVVLSGDNVFEDSLEHPVQQFILQEKGAKVLLKEVENPQRYGVPILKNNEIIFIEDKPSRPKSPYCITGIYMYHADVFEVSKRLETSAYNVLEITDLNNFYAVEGTLTLNVLEGWWTEVRTQEVFEELAVRLSKDLSHNYM